MQGGDEHDPLVGTRQQEIPGGLQVKPDADILNCSQDQNFGWPAVVVAVAAAGRPEEERNRCRNLAGGSGGGQGGETVQIVQGKRGR